MRTVLITIITAVALAGCDTAGKPAGTATVSLHGSVGASIGVSSH